jgi:glycine dehydrogenase
VRIADKVHGMASTLADALNKLVFIKPILPFDTIVVKKMQKKIRTIAEKNVISLYR